VAPCTVPVVAGFDLANARPQLRTPRSAAYAGMIFSLLLGGALVATHFALPEKPADAQGVLLTSPRRELLLVGLALIPFSAIAFLWFVGVLRDRIGDREDRFFATVFMGSGLLFAGVLLVAEAMITGVVLTATASNTTLSATPPAWWAVTRNISGQMIQAALQMAGVFTTATSTLLLRTGSAPRWLALSGTGLSFALIVGPFLTKWVGLLFVLWILALSIDILLTTRRLEAVRGQ